MFHEVAGDTTVPMPCRMLTRPLACSSFTDSRTTVRDTPNCAPSSVSVGRVAPDG
jgi:hypothetical protein